MKESRNKAEKELDSNEQRSSSSHRTKDASNGSSTPVGSLQRSIGNQAIQRLVNEGEIQPTLEVSRPTDPAEREAEQVAEAVMRAPEPEDNRQTAPNELIDTIGPNVGRSVQVRRHSTANDGGGGEDGGGGLERRIDSLKGQGESLPNDVRSEFGRKMGHDFSDVNVHTGSKADEAARSINARAFTHENDVVFRKGEYDPDSDGGKRLLAHELTHVVQQTGGNAVDRVTDIVQRENNGQTEGGAVEMGPTYVTGQLQKRTLGTEPFQYLSTKQGNIKENVRQLYNQLANAVAHVESALSFEDGEHTTAYKVVQTVFGAIDSVVNTVIGMLSGVMPAVGLPLAALKGGIETFINNQPDTTAGMAEQVIRDFRTKIEEEREKHITKEEGFVSKMQTKTNERLTDIDQGMGELGDNLLESQEEGDPFVARGVAAEFFNRLDELESRTQTHMVDQVDSDTIATHMMGSLAESGDIVGLEGDYGGYMPSGVLTISISVGRNEDGDIIKDDTTADSEWALRTESPLRTELANGIQDRMDTAGDIFTECGLQKRIHFTIETEASGWEFGDWQMEGLAYINESLENSAFEITSPSERDDDEEALRQALSSRDVFSAIPTEIVGQSY